jgi:hypothetical protein
MSEATRTGFDPPMVEGRYIDTIGRGCKTCGWYVPNEADPDDSKWMAHDHDPLTDIKERVFSGMKLLPVEDVVWLLSLVDPVGWTREPFAGDTTGGDE